MADEQVAAPQEDAPLVVNLNLIQPSGTSLSFARTPAATTLRQLKAKVREGLPSRPSDEQIRFIYRGHLLQRDTDTLLDVFTEQVVSVTLLCRFLSTWCANAVAIDPIKRRPTISSYGDQRCCQPAVWQHPPARNTEPWPEPCAWQCECPSQQPCATSIWPPATYPVSPSAWNPCGSRRLYPASTAHGPSPTTPRYGSVGCSPSAGGLSAASSAYEYSTALWIWYSASRWRTPRPGHGG